VTALAVAPVVVPLLTALLTTLTRQRAGTQQAISFAGIALLAGCALGLVQLAAAGSPAQFPAGGWPAPFGIEIAADRTSALLVLVSALLGAASLVFLAGDLEPRHPMLLPLVHGLLAGVGGSFCAADLFNLYVWFEVMLVCAVGLLAIGGRLDQLAATLAYLGLNLFGTILLLVAVGLVYAATGQLNFTALSAVVQTLPRGLTTALLTVLTLAFLVKAGAFPLFAWLPTSYPTLPPPVLALFAGLLTKVGVYAVLRTLGGVFAPSPGVLTEALGWIAAATMVTGVLGAAHHWDMRRILSFHIISQVGYILLAVALATDAGHAAMLFYTVHHMIVKANLFLIAAIIFRLTGSYDLRQIGGLATARPALAALFAIPALSLVGVPPLSGFWAKLLVLREAIAGARIAWTAIALGVSVLTLYSMLKIWTEAFWKPHPVAGFRPPALRLAPALAAAVALVTLTLAIGIAPEPLVAYAQAAARTLGGR